MDWVEVMANAAVTGFVGTAWYSLRSLIISVRNDVKKIAEEHNNCRSELPKLYATRQSNADLWGRVDQVSNRVSFLEGKHYDNDKSTHT